MLHDFLLDRLRPGWRERQAAQNPVWSFIEQLLVLLISGPLTFYAADLAFQFHFSRFPADLSRYGDGQPFLVIVTCFLLWGVVWCATAIALNWLEGRIPALRRIAEKGSEGIPELKIENANRTLMKVALGLSMVSLPLGAYLTLTSWA